VFVQLPNTDKPTFIAREVTLGKKFGNQYIILDGLNVGEEVVTHGNFKLDGAAQLADKLSMMNRNPGTGANRTGHEGHTMGAGENEDMQMDTDSPSIKKSQPEVGEEDHSEHQNMESTMNMSPTPDEFKNQLNEVVQKYFALKDALTESNAEKAAQATGQIETALSNVDMTLVKGEMHNLWMEHLKKIKNETSKIKQSKTLDGQRASFLVLSETLIESVKTFGLPGVIYQQFCPMTNNGNGGYWLSDSEKIANPYFGDKMHNCGEIITKIESN
jgi:Cu(I)/Ag(I) efflux system membrane fusion protein